MEAVVAFVVKRSKVPVRLGFFCLLASFYNCNLLPGRLLSGTADPLKAVLRVVGDLRQDVVVTDQWKRRRQAKLSRRHQEASGMKKVVSFQALFVVLVVEPRPGPKFKKALLGLIHLSSPFFIGM